MARGAGCCVALLFGLAIVCLLVPPLNPPHPLAHHRPTH